MGFLLLLLLFCFLFCLKEPSFIALVGVKKRLSKDKVEERRKRKIGKNVYQLSVINITQSERLLCFRRRVGRAQGVGTVEMKEQMGLGENAGRT